MPVRMELSRILIREQYDSHILELREVDGERTFPIAIGPNEAMAIERRLMEQQPPRPQTHELLAEIIRRLGARVVRILINDLRDSTFFARLILEHDGQTLDIDSRPSDAIALGASQGVPIYVAEHVLEEACRPPEADPASNAEDEGLGEPDDEDDA